MKGKRVKMAKARANKWVNGRIGPRGSWAVVLSGLLSLVEEVVISLSSVSRYSV